MSETLRSTSNKKLARAIETLRGDIALSPDALRDYALELVTEFARADGGLWYELGMVRGNPYPIRYRTLGMTPPIERQREEEIPWPTTDPRLPPKSWNRAFVLLPTVIRDRKTQLLPSRLYQRVWQPCGLVDQLRMVVYHRGEHIAWIGAGRTSHEPPFSRADQRRLAPLANALADALITAHSIERKSRFEDSCDVLLDPLGRVSHTSSEGRLWIERPGISEWLKHWARAVDRGEPIPNCPAGWLVRWSRMFGPSGTTMLLLHLERVAPVRVHPAFVLSRMQREVGALAAKGATASEIASMQGISVETVRAHLKHIYELLSLTSRVELAHVFTDLAPCVEEEWTVASLRRSTETLRRNRNTI